MAKGVDRYPRIKPWGSVDEAHDEQSEEQICIKINLYSLIIMKGKKSKSTKKTYKRRAKRNYTRNYTTLSRGPNPIGQRFMTRLKYADTIQKTATTLMADQIFRLNSIFDPDLTNAGHQPYGHDQLVNLYNRYRVWKCAGTIEVVGTGQWVNTCLIANNNNTSFSNFTLAMESPFAISKSADLNGKTVYRFSYYLPKLNGCTRAEYKDDRFQSQVNTNPTEQMALHLCYQAGSSNTLIAINVSFMYYVEMFDPFELAQS